MNAQAMTGISQASSLSADARRRLLSARGEPLFLADWHRVLMIHLKVDPSGAQEAVPFPLDLHQGRAFVTLVAFTLNGLKPRAGGKLAALLFRPIATHNFLNVRTYVKVNGEAGIHFLAEWLSNRLAVGLGPRTFSLPYRLGQISYDHNWSRRWMRGTVEEPGTGLGLRYRSSLRPDTEFAPCDARTLDHWLMERYSAFNSVSGRKRFFRVWHEPWLQSRLQTVIEDHSLLLHYWPWMRGATVIGSNFSPGVNGVWMGRPHRVAPLS